MTAFKFFRILYCIWLAIGVLMFFADVRIEQWLFLVVVYTGFLVDPVFDRLFEKEAIVNVERAAFIAFLLVFAWNLLVDASRSDLGAIAFKTIALVTFIVLMWRRFSLTRGRTG